MAIRLAGKEPAQKIREELLTMMEPLPEKQVNGETAKAVLSIVMVGDNSDSEAYIRGIERTCNGLMIAVRKEQLPADISQSAFMETFQALNNDCNVDGIIVMQPLPKHLNFEEAKAVFDPDKDVDAVTTENQGKVFLDKEGYPPCTSRIRH